MAINKFYLKKWYKMMTKNSILHVKQPIGKLYDKRKIKGYYNDLSEKVLKLELDDDEIPLVETSNGEKVEFSITIFQYGLGAYDLYLKTKNKHYLNKFKATVKWAILNQDENGGWNNKKYFKSVNPYSAMSQGQGVSLLLRAYVNFNDDVYFVAAKNAIDLMLKNIVDGGCTDYTDNMLILKEFPDEPVVLNGWIFSLFGIYDYMIITNDDNIKKIFYDSVYCLKNVIYKFDIKYWSKYDIDKKIASPFYHELHIDLLKVMYELTNEEVFKYYFELFQKYKDNKLNCYKAFLKKVKQKILER